MAIKIFIDQGHNPQNPNAGAESDGIREQDINYSVGKALEALLAADGRFEVKVSRNTPESSLGSSNGESLAIRAREANDWGADWFISIHANASTVSSASGSEAYVYSALSPAFEFSEYILDGLNRSTSLPNRGVFVRPSLYVLRATDMPATLIELGFITNPDDAALMVNSPWLFANGIYSGILDYFAFD